MTWRSIRLELACSRTQPRGSAGRAYLLWVPLRDDGRIDEAAVRRSPVRATVKRFWPSQADMAGYVVRDGGGWAFLYERNGDGALFVAQPLARPFRLGSCVALAEPGGSRLRFMVASLKPPG